MKKYLLFLFLLASISCKSQLLDWYNSYPTSTASTPTIINFIATNHDWCEVFLSASVSDNGSNITERGYYWTYFGDPVPSGTKVTVSGTTGLMTTFVYPGNNATIQVRAFATNSIGTTYSNQIEVSTIDYPTLTLTATNLTQTTASLNFYYPTTGEFYSRQIKYGISSVNENSTSIQTEINDPYTWNITGLTAGTTYKYVGIYTTDYCSYTSQEQTFTTQSAGCTLATVTTSSFDYNGLGGGNVTADGGCSVTDRGICWSESPNPTILDRYVSRGSGTGSFTASISSPTCGTTYYIRSYATNSVGTAYGNQITWTYGIGTLPSNSNTIWYALFSDNCSTQGNFTSSQSTCCTAISEYRNSSCTNTHLSGTGVYADSFTVGNVLYYNNKCRVSSTGYYFMIIDGSDKVVYINDGLISSITTCP